MRAARSVVLIAALQALPVSAGAACNVVAPDLSFGPYDPLAATASVTTSGTIVVFCNSSPPPTVTVTIGPSVTSGAFFPRRMRHAAGPDVLDYNLYVDPAAAVVWGDGRPGTGVRTDRVFGNKPWILTIYGRMPPGQDVSPGRYADSLSISVMF